MSKIRLSVILLLAFFVVILPAQQPLQLGRQVQNERIKLQGIVNPISHNQPPNHFTSNQNIENPAFDDQAQTAIAQSESNGFYLVQHISQNIVNGQLSTNATGITIYDLDGNAIEKYSEIWRGDQPEISDKVTSVYDAAGNIIQSITQERSGTSDQPALENRSRDRYEYDYAGRRINALFDIWYEGTWLESARTRSTFDEYDRMTEEVRSYFLPNGTGWELGNRIVNLFDSLGNLIEIRRERWSPKDSLWLAYWRGIYTFDEANRMIHDSYESSSGYDTLVVEHQSFYTYDDADNRIGVFTQIPVMNAGQVLSWENDSRITSTYDVSGNKISEIEAKWQYDEWSKVRFEESTFDAFHNQTEYLRENWDGDRLLEYYKVSKKYDALNNLIEKLTEKWNPFFQSTYTKDEYKFDEYKNMIEFVSSSFANEAWTILSKRMYKYTNKLSTPEENPRYTERQADYLIVYSSEFKVDIAPFIQWRMSQGLSVYTCEIKKIDDAFSYWPQKEKALREFVTYAQIYWPAPAPRFLLLVGNQEKIPSFQVKFQNSVKDSVAVDEWFAVNCFDTQEIPSLAIGRFPVNNTEELQQIIHKTKTLEETPAEADWTDLFIFLSDIDAATVNQDDYEILSANFIKNTLPENFRTVQMDIRETSPNYATKQQFIEAINQGAINLLYNGRGNAFALSSTDFFTADDVDSLTANNKPCFFTALGVDLVAEPSDSATLATKLLTSPDRGTAAILTSSGRNSADQNFLESFYLRMFLYPDLTIGEAILQAKQFSLPQGASPDHAIRRYTLLGDPSLKIPFSEISNIEFTEPLKSAEHQADYLVIYAKQFEQPLDSFISWREKQGYKMKRVDVRKIFSEFYESASRSEAIRDFISYTTRYWKKPGPKHALLVGDLEHIPSYRVRSTSEGDPEFISIDEWLTVSTFEEDDIPDIAIGRFPVNNTEELNRLIAKTTYFEDSLTFYSWPKAFLMVNDAHTNSNNPELFEKLAEDFIATILPAQFNFSRIDLRPTAEYYGTRQDLFAALNEGTLFFNYFGHGSPSFWSQSRFFTVNDIVLLSKTTYPFIHTSIGCSQVYPELGERSLVDELLKYPHAGAVAVLASSGVNVVEQNFIQEFYKLVFASPALTIGETILITKSRLLATQSSSSAMVRRYTLLGDPALRFPLHGVTAIDNRDEEPSPLEMSLSQNYPNPFNHKTTILYSLAKPAHVVLKVYDLLGRQVAVLVDDKQSAGTHKINFVPSNLASGVFICRLDINGHVARRKLLFFK
ncbi:MAG: T9SS type A sorting domain-containing protein [Deferribacteres bacterium]|nr:T9SS type A sorting domain-containing protein [candidate division KSB1 bacterium]MCB9503585.1 T9SS type A sorting domain-containing protein [Deferribacteres bacterium]